VWVRVPPAPLTPSLIDAVQAFGSRNVWVVGTLDGKGGTRTLILHRTGRP
jgi:hypothetical protein